MWMGGSLPLSNIVKTIDELYDETLIYISYLSEVELTLKYPHKPLQWHFYTKNISHYSNIDMHTSVQTVIE